MSHSHQPPDQDFNEFKEHLLRRHRQNYAHRQHAQPAQPPADAQAGRLGRYLRAARLNAGLSPAALAQRAKLSTDTILALEQGLILRQAIKAGWLKRLAAALNEDADDFALLLGRRRQHRWDWPVLRLPRTVYMPLVAALMAVVISAAMLAKAGLPVTSSGADAVYTPPQSTLASSVAPVPLMISTYAHLNPAERQSLLKAERLKVAPAGAGPVVISVPPVVEANPVTYLFLNSKLNNAPAEPQPRTRIFFDIVYWLTSGRRFQLEGRPSVISAEFGLESQILVPPKIININSENRLNMVKAEFNL